MNEDKNASFSGLAASVAPKRSDHATKRSDSQSPSSSKKRLMFRKKSIETSRSHSFGSSESDHPNTVTNR